ncbi:MAG: RDD family protein [Acidobacteriota bacterium]
MKCAFCASVIDDGSRFCAFCGKEQPPQEIKCGNCGMKAEPGQGFCTGCGNRIGAPTSVAPTTLPTVQQTVTAQQAAVPQSQVHTPQSTPVVSQQQPAQGGYPIVTAQPQQQGMQYNPVMAPAAGMAYAGQSVIPKEALAGVFMRFLAIFIDGIIGGIVMYVLAVPMAMGTVEGGQIMLGAAGTLIFFGLGIVYFTLFEGIVGGTPGKILVGIRVIKEDGSKCTVGGAIIRTLLRIVDLIPFIIPYLLAAIMVWVTDKNQRLGDKVAGTVVVYKHKMR